MEHENLCPAPKPEARRRQRTVLVCSVAQNTSIMNTPQQARLDEYVPTQTEKYGQITMARMQNQWKTSAAYVTAREPVRPSKQFLPGGTASGVRRVFPDEVAAGYSPSQTMYWPPRLP